MSDFIHLASKDSNLVFLVQEEYFDIIPDTLKFLQQEIDYSYFTAPHIESIKEMLSKDLSFLNLIRCSYLDDPSDDFHFAIYVYTNNLTTKEL